MILGFWITPNEAKATAIKFSSCDSGSSRFVMRDIKVVYVPPVCIPKVVRGGDVATWEGISSRLIAAHVPGVTTTTYLELHYPVEGKRSLTSKC